MFPDFKFIDYTECISFPVYQRGARYTDLWSEGSLKKKLHGISRFPSALFQFYMA